LRYKSNRNKGEEDAGHYEEGDGCVKEEKNKSEDRKKGRHVKCWSE
jgi:hypothetical protein